MIVKRVLLAVLIYAALWSPAVAQSETSSEPISVDPDVHKLDLISQRMEAYMSAMPTFEVETKARWTLDRDNRKVRDSRCSLKVRHPSSFHLRVGSEAVGDAWLDCVSDGKTITRLYRTKELDIFSKHEGGLKEILDDAMTYSSVKGSGLDLLVRPDLHSHLMTSVTQVKDLGEELLGGQRAHHFSAMWYDDSQVDLWIAAEREPLLLRWQRRRKLDLGDDQPREVKIDCNLTWTPHADLPDEFADISIPAEAAQVSDIQHYLMEGRTTELLGQPAPRIDLKMLSGKSWQLSQHRDQHFVVLFFFASWAAPSTNGMPAVLRFVEEYEQQGVVFYAIDVGEDAGSVRTFVEKQEYTHPVVLDPKQQATAAYRITSLPVTVLIGKNGTVQAVHVGTSPEERKLIRADMEALVAGKQLVTAEQQQEQQ
ncbi:redoxin domain-containing protein [Novipirellula artificiosorum]|uniref:Thiol-disulfide oxidoreductase ResA n=1 Tax=Novipirellula artificiosorum TaxID=2528016 RepID=A0A5C6CZY9_9BACT|nr:redoxin domain-containing protein [Novipirellula artificiosorum]TWU29051.1 Thiol-disulfide oxidoreductase ResA [Novipirellula artificiosorum]